MGAAGSEVSTCLPSTNPLITKIQVRLDPRSTCSRTVLLTCAELKLESREDIKYEVISLNLGMRDQKSNEHMKYHPFGKVPVLITESIVLYETEAIMRYLARNVPGSKLVPRLAYLKAHMDKLISIYSGYLKPAFHNMYWELVLRKRYSKPGPCDEEKVRQSQKQTEVVLGILESEFRKTNGEYFVGDKLTLADLYIFPAFIALEHAGKLEVLLTGLPYLGSWNRRMKLRESFKSLQMYKVELGHNLKSVTRQLSSTACN